MKKEIIDFQNKINYKENSNYINCYLLEDINFALHGLTDTVVSKLEKTFFKNLKLKYMNDKELFSELINLNRFPFKIYVPTLQYLPSLLKNPILFKIIIEDKYKCLLRYFASLLSYQYNCYITTLDYGNIYEGLKELKYDNFDTNQKRIKEALKEKEFKEIDMFEEF